ncbi:hypothetical protein QQF73_16455 [Marinobacter sp. M216]|uniref:Phage tail protein n=1 Tax=Marinobacter albus TaxID=3030833 RepID=A0ABT7HFS2_9GAMM|nr:MULTISPECIES: hypothetical protein [unclassified Marinobacter]MBW7472675.1 hypothetical protein [Marinobacter sp. F4218]MDK9559228.1 hypothetical protein [Marinobacter sp. M216]
MPASEIYSAKVGAGEGFSGPAPLAGLPSWTVSKQQQTEIYEITHNLNLNNPELDMQVVATSMTPGVSVVVENVGANSFRVSAWTNQLAAAETDFMFIAYC